MQNKSFKVCMVLFIVIYLLYINQLNKAKMKNLFHSIKEKITFWVPGYDYSNDNVNENIEYLKGNAKKFSNETGITQVFYADNENIPKEAFEIGEKSDWTMWKCLND